VAEATSKQIGNPGEPNPDWRQGYGFQFWMSRHGYRGDGAFGQFCVILPEQETVIVTTAYTLDMQAVPMPSGPACCPASARSHPALAAATPPLSRSSCPGFVRRRSGRPATPSRPASPT
jgi:hypothetical protein